MSVKAAKPKQEYALVKWITGAYSGTTTPNVQVDWIRDFDKDNIDFQNAYVVEWRVPPKPSKGWHFYDALIIEVSDNLSFLRRKEQAMSMLDCTSPKRTPTSAKIPSTSTPRSGLESPSSQPDLLTDRLHGSCESFYSNDSTSIRRQLPQQQVIRPQENQVLVGKTLTVSRSCYLDAKTARTPTSMVMTLVRAAFSVKRLSRSTYAGQKRRDVSKPSLKKYQKMRDIQDFVLEKFPSCTQSQFSAAVNACTGPKAMKPTVEYVFESEDSE